MLTLATTRQDVPWTLVSGHEGDGKKERAARARTLVRHPPA